MKWIRLKYLRLLKSALSWFEFRSILLELFLILNVKELIVGESIALLKKFKEPIGIKEILKSVDGTKTKAAYQSDPGNEALKDQLQAIADDLNNKTNHSTHGLITRTFKEYEYVNGYHVWKPYAEFSHIGLVWKDGGSEVRTIIGNTAIEIIVHKGKVTRLQSRTYNTKQFTYLFNQLVVNAPFYNDMIVGGVNRLNSQSIENYFKNLKVKLHSKPILI